MIAAAPAEPSPTATHTVADEHATPTSPFVPAAMVPADHDVPPSLERSAAVPTTATQVVAAQDTPRSAGARTVVFCDQVDPPSVDTKTPTSPTATHAVTDAHDTAL